jgi:2-polyprenyl-3-methyl-5-hydroxy-6-metoxy-1,4-benzoquinol methylase
MASSAHEGKTHWDKVYADEGYGMDPDPEVVQIEQQLPAGAMVLDVGAGEGRNALWLAAQGCVVRAIDVSRVGLQKLRERAEVQGLEVDCILASAADYDFGEASYDLVLSAGCALNFFKKDEAKRIIERMKAAVKPAGFIHVSVSTVHDPSWQRVSREVENMEDDSFFSRKWDCWVCAFQPGELRECFPDFKVPSYEEREVHDTHGKPHTHVMAFLTAGREV